MSPLKEGETVKQMPHSSQNTSRWVGMKESSVVPMPPHRREVVTGHLLAAKSFRREMPGYPLK